MASTNPAAREPLLAIDNLGRKTFIAKRNTPVVKAISWFSQLGDQPQMRILSGGLLALGLLRGDARMVRAGARMLVAHELATSAKNFVKHRVDRVRPRSADSKAQQKPRAGDSEAKEDTSFPSGHSAGSLSVALAFAREYPQFRGAAIATATGVALAQIPRCAHYPTDVAAGMALGAAAEKVVAVVIQASTGKPTT